MARHEVSFDHLRAQAIAESVTAQAVFCRLLHSTARYGHESTCSTGLICQTKNFVMPSTPLPEAGCVKQRRFQGLPSAKKLDTSSQCQSGYVAAHAIAIRTETSLDFIERAQAGPLRAKAERKPPALSPIQQHTAHEDDQS